MPPANPSVRYSLAAAALALSLALSGTAQANSCPKHMKAIDEALATQPKLDDKTLAEVKTLRMQGEEQHKAGQHAASMDSLTKAEKLLGIKGHM